MLTLRCILFCSSCILPPLLPNFISHFVSPVFPMPETVRQCFPLLDDAESNHRICWGSVHCWPKRQENRIKPCIWVFASFCSRLPAGLPCFWWSGSTHPFWAWRSVTYWTLSLKAQNSTNTTWERTKDNHFAWANCHYLSVSIVLIRTLGIFFLCRNMEVGGRKNSQSGLKAHSLHYPLDKVDTPCVTTPQMGVSYKIVVPPIIIHFRLGFSLTETIQLLGVPSLKASEVRRVARSICGSFSNCSRCQPGPIPTPGGDEMASFQELPLGEATVCYWKWPIDRFCSWFTH